MPQVIVGPADVFAPVYTARVIPVNCVGVMGKGLALEAGRRYPALQAVYATACRKGFFSPGNVYVYPEQPDVWLAATKNHWRHPSEAAWVIACCRALAERTHLSKPTSLVVPALGCGLGQLGFADMVGAFVRELLCAHDVTAVFLATPGSP